MDYTYAYLTFGGLFLLLWLPLFLARKDLRAKMLFLSTVVGAWSLSSEWMNVTDWWHPPTVTGTLVGIEDFIFGFAIAGIASVAYEELFRKRLRVRKRTGMRASSLFFLLTLALLYPALFYIVGLPSFFAMMGAAAFGIACMLVMRRDLALPMFASGALMLVIGIPVYFLLFVLFPGYIEALWYLDTGWHTELFLGIPVEEYVWLFVTGMLLGPLHEFLEDKDVISMPRVVRSRI